MLKMTPLVEEVSAKWEPVFIDLAQEVLQAASVEEVLRIVNGHRFQFCNVNQIHLVLIARNELNHECFAEYSFINGEVRFANRFELERFSDRTSVVTLPYEAFRRDFPCDALECKYLNFSSYCRVPLFNDSKLVGWVEYLSAQVDEFDQLVINKLRQLSNIVAIGIGNVMDKESSKRKERRLRKESKNNEVLVDITNAVLSQDSLDSLAASLHHFMQKHFDIKHLSLMSVGKQAEELLCFDVMASSHLQLVDDKHCDNQPSVTTRTIKFHESPFEIVFDSRKPLLIRKEHLDKYKTKYPFCEQIIASKLESACVLPLIFRDHVWGAIKFCHSDKHYFERADIELLEQVAARTAMGLNSFHLSSEIAQTARLNEPVECPKETLDEDIGEIVYRSQAMAEVLAKVKMVAQCDCTVLILGETGTGKELIARAIHQLSNRNDKAMVKMNCASVPTGLFESDLFGHEKGAFTGALSKRIGRFELADKGTFFLDEVGDMPIDLQPKLLRVLQESEFERVGCHKLINVDTRLIAATNRDLLSMVRTKEFRSDLYYRLNVFPIELPPLRERREDIPLLAKHFVCKISKKMGKNISSIPSETLRLLSLLPWSGNIRELRNVIERAVVTTQGKVLNIPAAELKALLSSTETRQLEQAESQSATPESVEDEQDIERERIIAVLKETNGIVAGPRGAATKLGLKRTTLLSRMQRLGISSKSYSS
ncbi:sigma 54-interacting transcriptional regulator [Paraferrimonas sedimenticola]|uniref:Formate hydrogenlyase transcriptional activator n=1 Tax=Paraferrimonas sedimenticola TaxID=375674 RepID=A0AA37RYB3_9GAMM|nr:sigma 54-interacting transcriptional regulator [Paraferrimonas sedimenticola]GLP97306.1 formate hydrogenlyase transcriptional activator [Paraferrimonas sedimenticola]